MRTWILASHNKGKLAEFNALTAPHAITLRSAAELGLPEPEETGHSFEANAALKAEAATHATGQHAISDDSGLVIPALDGAPGIYSARWAGETKDFRIAMQRVHDEFSSRNIPMEGASAHFVCVIAVARPHAPTKLFRGEVHGHLTWPARGDKGFGYNPIFIATGERLTFAEMEDALRYGITHRKRAFDAFVHWLATEKAA